MALLPPLVNTHIASGDSTGCDAAHGPRFMRKPTHPVPSAKDLKELPRKGGRLETGGRTLRFRPHYSGRLRPQPPMPDSSERGETGGETSTGRNRSHTSRELRSSRLLRAIPPFCNKPSCSMQAKPPTSFCRYYAALKMASRTDWGPVMGRKRLFG